VHLLARLTTRSSRSLAVMIGFVQAGDGRSCASLRGGPGRKAAPTFRTPRFPLPASPQYPL